MLRHLTVATVLLGVVLLVGCDAGQSPGTTRMLGSVNYDKAFQTARQVMGRHFDIRSAEPVTGVITTLPEGGRDRPTGVIALSSGEVRRLATLRLTRSGNQVEARLAIAVQTASPAPVQRFDVGANYDSVPNQSPSELEAATTTEQNVRWQTRRHDTRMETQILNELFREMNPAASQAGEPIVPTQPAAPPSKP